MLAAYSVCFDGGEVTKYHKRSPKLVRNNSPGLRPKGMWENRLAMVNGRMRGVALRTMLKAPLPNAM